MRNLHIAVMFISLLAMLLAAACGTQSANQSAQNGSERPQAEPLTGSAKDFERAQFDDPTHIDNRWLPLRPGTQLVYEGSAIPDEGVANRVGS